MQVIKENPRCWITFDFQEYSSFKSRKFQGILSIFLWMGRGVVSGGPDPSTPPIYDKSSFQNPRSTAAKSF